MNELCGMQISIIYLVLLYRRGGLYMNRRDRLGGWYNYRHAQQMLLGYLYIDLKAM